MGAVRPADLSNATEREDILDIWNATMQDHKDRGFQPGKYTDEKWEDQDLLSWGTNSHYHILVSEKNNKINGVLLLRMTELAAPPSERWDVACLAGRGIPTLYALIREGLTIAQAGGATTIHNYFYLGLNPRWLNFVSSISGIVSDTTEDNMRHFEWDINTVLASIP